MRGRTGGLVDRTSSSCDYRGVTTTARETFLAAAEAALSLSPAPRGAATAATFREIAALPAFDEGRCPLSTADLGLALVTIWCHYAALLRQQPEEEQPKWIARATTLSEVGEALRPGYPSSWNGTRESALHAWGAVADTFPGDDARARAIRETWGREAGFLAD